MSRVLVVAPHPDDESVGCGGTILAHRAAGDDVRIVFVTSGEAGGHGASPEETARRREAEARTAADILDVSTIDFWRFPDGRLRASAALVGLLVKTLTEWRPDSVYVTGEHDMHPDHRAVGRGVRRAVASTDGNVAVWLTEVWTPVQDLGLIVDVTPHLERKLAAIRAHASQCAVLPFDDAFEGLARYRGAMHSWPDGDYAEAFTRLR